MFEDSAMDDDHTQEYGRHYQNTSIKGTIQTQGRDTEGKADPNKEHDNFPLSSEGTGMNRPSIGDASEGELRRVATIISQRKQSIAQGSTSSDVQGDPALDVQSGSFDPVKWLRSFLNNFHDQDGTPKNTGILYRSLDVYGRGSALQIQQTVGSYFLAPMRFRELLRSSKKQARHILHNFDGVLQSGELLIVLGRPGSGCSTLLKTMCGELFGLHIGEDSKVHYNGISQDRMMTEFKGEIVYNQEVEKHFPHLTVGQTLEFASRSRLPVRTSSGMSRNELSKHCVQIVMAVLGLSHTYNTKVGNDFIRGVSGGERKRVSIAEMMLSGSPFCAWDNSTRGLDSATALKFVQTLRLASDLGGSANAVAIYQASQDIYDIFDKATVLYEGRQIYFGPATAAKSFFERQGWHCPQRQTTGDFLTSVTNPQERRAQTGMEDKVPRTPEEFEQHWRRSPEYQALMEDMQVYERNYPPGGQNESLVQLRNQKNYAQAKHVRPKSPYTLSVIQQIGLCTKRAYQRIMGDIAATATNILINVVLSLVLGSVFFNTPDATVGFSSKGAVLFMGILLSALSTIAEINSLYAQRPVVEKHASYAFYHPCCEAIAGIIAEIPIKFCSSVVFNLILYFMAGLRREPAQFFIFFLITYITTFVMSAAFRTMAALTKTISQAMALAGVLSLALVMYTGYVVSVPQMKDWFSWIRYVNPIFYAFEILIANEFHGREFTCSEIIPSYTPLVGDSWICSAVGSIAGRRTVSGDDYIAKSYQYYYSHVWRNFGILLAFLFGLMGIYFWATECNSSTTSTAEVLVFQRGHVPEYLQENDSQTATDEEKGAEHSQTKPSEPSSSVQAMEPQKDIFTWRDVVYDIEIKGEPRRLLDHVSGWVQPGTLTALMGVSGAGKTTLLDVLAQRTTMGVITGDMFVNGKPLDASFQRKTGYVQQQDLHLDTATVRESLRFSAMLRQPASVSMEEKYEFVEKVIDMLNMGDFANAVVGIPGEGLNVEQRKLLTIGVELAARPKLLLFLDEPTSGLDSQSSWAICAFLRKLADAGQAVLCTVHQPSAILFQEFDRLLFLARGGRTVYFGKIGKNSRTLLDYFESNGARKCEDAENPAEYMIETVNNGPRDKQDWHAIWKASPERSGVEAEIDRLHAEKANEPVAVEAESGEQAEFAAPLARQFQIVTNRVFQQYWRMPEYVLSKFVLSILGGLFVGFTFYDVNATQAGMANVMFAIFMITALFSTLVQQVCPHSAVCSG
ncbi:unnamed protein product [Alternaria alternata]